MQTLNFLLEAISKSKNLDTHQSNGTYIPHSASYEHSLLKDGIKPQDETFKFRTTRIEKSQIEYANLFDKLNVIIGQLQEKYPRFDSQTTHVEEDVVSVGTEPSSGASTSSETRTASSSNASNHKRKICLEDDFIEIDEYDPGMQENRKYFIPNRKGNLMSIKTENFTGTLLEKQTQQVTPMYPKRINSEPPLVVLGPNGTIIPSSKFDNMIWSSAAAATRSILGIIFSSDVLATHTLTGKPSPAFHGRERPPKLQLDPQKTSDIIHCVRVMCDGTEREIRAAITTKCADTAKKYKRRSLKAASR